MLSTLNIFNMFRLIIATALIVNGAMTPCFAAEIDSVTTRKVKLDNSRAAINHIFNQRIKEGIEQLNNAPTKTYVVGDVELFQEKDYCDEEELYTVLRKAIFESGTVAWGLKGYHLDKQLRDLLVKQSYSLPLNDSIYRDIDYIEGISLNLKDLSDVVNIEGNLIGIDKIGHFFAEGWKYFEIMESQGKTIYDALTWGKEKESGLFGYSTTGIFSYADLVANFNGMRFWNKVLLKQNDPLKDVVANLFERPYVVCDLQLIDSIKTGKIVKAWVYNARFDIADYVDGSWDEGNNCNSYADPIIEEKVAKRIRDIEPEFACPYRREACSGARDKYDQFARYLLHPNCFNTQKR